VTTNAKKLLTDSWGIIKPAILRPLNVNAEIEILETAIVKRYKIIAFIKKENIPIVIIFKGRVIIFNIGLMIKNNIERAIPPTIYVAYPPFTVNPVTA